MCHISSQRFMQLSVSKYKLLDHIIHLTYLVFIFTLVIIFTLVYFCLFYLFLSDRICSLAIYHVLSTESGGTAGIKMRHTAQYSIVEQGHILKAGHHSDLHTMGHFWLSQLGVEYYWPLVGRGQDAAKHLIMHRTKNYLAQNINSAKAKKVCYGPSKPQKDLCCILVILPRRILCNSHQHLRDTE